MKKIFPTSNTHKRRIKKTLEFLDGRLSFDDVILDLGPENLLGNKIKDKGFNVINTSLKTDLDLDYSVATNAKLTVLTAFEILEHLVSPFPILNNTPATKLVASVPLKLWFASAYWNEEDPYDRHYHEFEPRQFDMLLEKAGWKIVDSEKWTSPTKILGIRPILRRFTPRYYIVYCERI